MAHYVHIDDPTKRANVRMAPAGTATMEPCLSMRSEAAAAMLALGLARYPLPSLQPVARRRLQGHAS